MYFCCCSHSNSSYVHSSSHMDFEPEWDERMVEMWYLAENEYAVLSTYVANIGENSTMLNFTLIDQSYDLHPIHLLLFAWAY
jgi:hypothetical protein